MAETTTKTRARPAAVMLTPSAESRIAELMAQAPEGAIGVKLSTPKRGCSGLAYSVDYVTEEAKQELQELLNNGILQKVKDDYVKLSCGIHGNERRQHVLYEDGQVKVVGDTLASGGYLYVAAWLKPQEESK